MQLRQLKRGPGGRAERCGARRCQGLSSGRSRRGRRRGSSAIIRCDWFYVTAQTVTSNYVNLEIFSSSSETMLIASASTLMHSCHRDGASPSPSIRVSAPPSALRSARPLPGPHAHTHAHTHSPFHHHLHLQPYPSSPAQSPITPGSTRTRRAAPSPLATVCAVHKPVAVYGGGGNDGGEKAVAAGAASGGGESSSSCGYGCGSPEASSSTQ